MCWVYAVCTVWTLNLKIQCMYLSEAWLHGIPSSWKINTSMHAGQRNVGQSSPMAMQVHANLLSSPSLSPFPLRALQAVLQCKAESGQEGNSWPRPKAHSPWLAPCRKKFGSSQISTQISWLKGQRQDLPLKSD